MLMKKNWLASLVIAPVMLAASLPAHALFGDDEARKAILDLREKVEAAQNAQLMLQNQIEALREQNARLIGRVEELSNQLTLEQRSNRDLYTDLDKRMAELEPADVELDGRTVRVSAEERRLYTLAVSSFSQGKYEESEELLRTLTANYPQTGYMPAALFWLGNSLYASGELKQALEVENKLLKEFPKDARVPDALLTKAAAEVTGEWTKYFVNVTSGSDRIMENVKRVADAGADGIMVNFATAGYSTLKQIAESAGLPILGHMAGAGMYYEGTLNGMASPLAAGKLARLAGADIVMVNTPYGGYPLRHQKYMQTLEQLTLPWYNIQPCMPSIGGGVHPGVVEKYVREAGWDIVLASGGAIQGHPGGATAGAKAMRQAVEIVMEGGDFEEKAREKKELSEALEKWHYVK